MVSAKSLVWTLLEFRGMLRLHFLREYESHNDRTNGNSINPDLQVHLWETAGVRCFPLFCNCSRDAVDGHISTRFENFSFRSVMYVER